MLKNEKNNGKRKIIYIILGLLVLILIIGVWYYYGNVSKISNNKPSENDNKNGRVLYLCNSSIGLIIKEKGDVIDINNICLSEDYIGKYICKSDSCGLAGRGQMFSPYINHETGVVAINDQGGDFLYNFKQQNKISENYKFISRLYGYSVDQNSKYMVVSTIEENSLSNNKKYGILRDDGTLITKIEYDYILPTEPGGSVDVITDTTISVRKNNFGVLLNYKTGKEIMEYDFIGGSCSSIDGNCANFNYIFNLAYVATATKSFIINVLDGQVKKEFNEVFDFALPLDENLLFIHNDNEIDVVDYSLKSVLKETLKTPKRSLWEVTYDPTSKNVSFYIGEDFFDSIEYTFNYDTKTLIKK